MKKDTQNNLIEIALKLFLEKGYDKVSVNDIVNRAKVSKGAFYHYFKSKDDLFFQTFDVVMNDLNRWFETLMQKDSFKDFLAGWFDYPAYFRNMRLEMEISMNLYDLIFDAVKKMPEMRKKISHYYRDFIESVSEKAGAAQRNGEIKKTVNSELLAYELTVLVEGLILFEVLLEDENSVSGKNSAMAEEIWERIKV